MWLVRLGAPFVRRHDPEGLRGILLSAASTSSKMRVPGRLASNTLSPGTCMDFDRHVRAYQHRSEAVDAGGGS